MEECEKKGRRDPEKEKYWRGAMSDHAGSGKSIRAFCAEKGLNENQFYAWRRELKLRDGLDGGKGGFVELIRKTVAPDGGAGIRIVIDDRLSIALERGFDLETLKAVVHCLGTGVRGG